MNITVYHISSAEIKKPSVDVNGENLGFGKGFYLTNSKIEAEALARKTADKNVISVYEFNYFKTKNVGYRFNEFETYNSEWLKFVVDCRKGKDVAADYDIVIAGAIYDEIADSILSAKFTKGGARDETHSRPSPCGGHPALAGRLFDHGGEHFHPAQNPSAQ